MKFKQFLLEAGPGFNHKIMDLDDAVMIASSAKYSGAMANLELNPMGFLFRGSRNFDGNKKAVLINTEGTKRTSENTINAYTLCFDANPYNADYPKRSESMICSSSYYGAAGYGEVYALLPANNAKIGVLAVRDMFFSKTEIAGHQMTNIYFNDDVVEPLIFAYMLYAGLESTSYISNQCRNIKTFEELLEKMFKGIVYLRDAENMRKMSNAYMVGDVIMQIVSRCKTKQELREMIFNFCNFDAQNAIHTNGHENFPSNEDAERECWISGEILMIHMDHLQKFKELISMEIK